MKGLELADKFYQEVVHILIEEHFPKLIGKYAAGLVGPGSDVLENDDELSRNHDWGPRCQIWLTELAYRKYAKGLDQLFAEKLPETFLGFGTSFSPDDSIQGFVPAGLEEEGVFLITITTVAKYLKDQYGLYTRTPNIYEWLNLSEQKLLELTRGRIFYDPIGDITRVRNNFAYFPEDIRRFKLLGVWESLDNYFETIKRCILREDILSARMILYLMVELMVRLTFLLNRRYCPGTMKWFSREFYNLPRLAGETGGQLEELLIKPDINQGYRIAEDVALRLIKENRSEFGDNFKPNSGRYSKQINSSIKNIIQALKASLPLEFQNPAIYSSRFNVPSSMLKIRIQKSGVSNHSSRVTSRDQ